MNAAFAPLSESFSATIDFALKWFLAGVSEIVLNQVLLKSEMLSTLVADPFFVYFVDLHVSLEAVLGLEDLVTSEDVAPKSFITLLIYLSHF
jgi:hypothetical protein